VTSLDADAVARRTDRDAFRSLIRSNPFGVYLVDADFRLSEVSLGAQKVFATVHPLLGRDFEEVLRILWPDPFASDALGRFRHTLATGEPYSAPSTVEQRKDIGDVEAYDWRIERLTLPDGRYGVICYFYDLSERQSWEKALKEGEKRLRLATDAAQLGIWSWDPTTDQVQWENDRPYEILGISRTDPPIGAARFTTDYLHPEDLPAFQEQRDRALRRESRFHFEGRIRRPDGEVRWIELTGATEPVDEQASIRFIGTIQDITARKTAEERLHTLAADLSMADRRKNEFLATLAHELRNPLAPITNSIALLRLAAADPVLSGKALATMERQVGHMVRLIEDLLDLSRITNDKLELKRERVELAPIIRQAVETCRGDLAKAGHALTVSLASEPIILDADPLRLSQVFANLLNNAGKYTEPGGRISLSAERDDDVLTVRVRDTGIGIPADMLSHVFEMFAQVDAARGRSHGGLGIGLSLVQRLVRMHGGTVTAHSEGAGHGSEFVVRLPLSVEPGIRDDAPPPEAGADTFVRRRMLIVEDCRENADTLEALLRRIGHEVHAVYDGTDAIQRARVVRPDVILLDIGLPGLDGHAVCRALRQEACGRRAKIVAVTGWGQDEDRQRSTAAGFDAHLVKPVELPALTALVQLLFTGAATGD